MIKTLQKRFIITAMIAVTVLLVVLLGGLSVINAWSSIQEEKQLLASIVQMEVEGRREAPKPGGDVTDGLPPEGSPPEGERHEGGPPQEEGVKPRGFLTLAPSENDRMGAVYFTVTVKNGVPISADVSRISTVNEEEAFAYAASTVNGSGSGRLDSFLYSSGERADGSLIYVFLDHSSAKNSIVRVTVLSALAGVAGWLLMLLLVVFLSRRAIRPIAENMERQRQFVTDAGHELKTPLAIIQANTEAMELITGETKWSRNIRGQVSRLTDLTGNLLTMTRSEELLDKRSLLPLDLSELTEQTLASFAPSMEAKQMELTSSIEKGLTVKGDKSQMTTLLSILFDNAAKYTPEGGGICLTLSGSGEKVRLRLENDCSSLPDCPADRLFDRFFRGDAARTQKSGGFGIGLSSAGSIARQHKGSLTAEYVGKDRIAFLLTVPREK